MLSLLFYLIFNIYIFFFFYGCDGFYIFSEFNFGHQSGGSETEVTWEDQQNINKFGRLNNRFHELEDEIRVAKVL